jgi:hypothetical protein
MAELGRLAGIQQREIWTGTNIRIFRVSAGSPSSAWASNDRSRKVQSAGRGSAGSSSGALGNVTYSNGTMTSFLGTGAVNFTNASSSTVKFSDDLVRAGVNYNF